MAVQDTCQFCGSKNHNWSECPQPNPPTKMILKPDGSLIPITDNRDILLRLDKIIILLEHINNQNNFYRRW